MALRKIARMGHPVLRSPAAAVEDPQAAGVALLVRDMIETMEDAGGAGIAAPQLYEPLRILVFRVPPERVSEDPSDLPQDLTVLINPSVEALGRERALAFEGCLSLPGLRGAVPRAFRIGYRGLTLEGRTIEREVSGFHARLVQHECDHLEGILYPQRMSDLRLLTFVEELARHPIDLSAPIAAEREKG